MGIPGDDQRTGRRSSGLLRVPFVRRCALAFADGRQGGALIVNINTVGAYVTARRPGRRGGVARPAAAGGGPGDVPVLACRTGTTRWTCRRWSPG